MLKRIFFTFHFSFLTALCAFAQSSDPIVMTVGGVSVPRSEFEYNYKKNNTDAVVDKKGVHDYADLYAIYKMKVLAAKDARMDTVQSYQKEFRQYRDQLVKPMLVPDSMFDAECYNYYDGMVKALGGKDLLQPAHILILLKQNATKEDQDKAKSRIDSIYNVLKGGADFAEVAKQSSDDRQTAVKGGMLPWIGPGNTLKEFEDIAYSLKVGEMSKPFLSTVGYHIIKMMDRKQLEPYDSLYPQISQFMEHRGVRERLSGEVVNQLVAKYDSAYTPDQILDMETERLAKDNEDVRFLVQEYHDGLLLYNICNEQVWEPAKRDTLGMQNYFKANKKQYAWSDSRFSGMVYYCKNAADVQGVKNLLKKVSDDKWVTTVRAAFNKDSVTVRMDRRLFVVGDNKAVDSLVFKKAGAGFEPMKGFQYVGCLGKVLKKGPAKWTDVASQVSQDYQQKKMDDFVAELKKRYPVVIYEENLPKE